jgi:hypothetical protein
MKHGCIPIQPEARTAGPSGISRPSWFPEIDEALLPPTNWRLTEAQLKSITTYSEDFGL